MVSNINIILCNSTNIKLLFIYLIVFCGTSFGQLKSIKVHGFVHDSKTNEILVGTLITVQDSGVAQTNNTGYFSFHIKPGRYNISTQMLGYEKKSQIIYNDGSDEEEKLFFRLIQLPIEITQITVTGEQFKENVRYKTYELQQGDLRNIPQFGEPDPFRAIQALPAVTSINDFSAQLYLRGGNFDETLIAIDEVPIYNPYHLGGMFSMFNSDIINSQTLYPSNYPVKYGGYLSGALNIKTKYGNREKLKGSASIGLISSKVYMETPVSDGTLMLSARRTYLDFLGALFTKSEMPYYFYDLFGKFSYPINEKNYLSISGFYSRDIFKVYNEEQYINANIDDQPSWGNNLFSLDYSYFLSKEQSIDFKLYYSSSGMGAKASSYSNDRFLNQTVLNIENTISDYTAQIRTITPFTGHEIEIGLELKSIRLNYGWNIGDSELSDFGFNLEDTFFDFAPSLYSYEQNTYLANCFIADKLQLTKKLAINIGVRATYADHLKEILLSPSIDFIYKINDQIDLAINYGRYYQTMHVIKDQNSLILDPFSVYFLPANVNNLSSSNNVSANIAMFDAIWNSDIEISGYYGLRTNLASSYSKSKNPYRIEDGYSTGLEFLIRKDFGVVYGFGSYSISRSIKSNFEYEYYVRNDRTHTIKIMLNFDISDSWHFSSYWTFATGLPYTPSIGSYVGADIPDLDDHTYSDKYIYWYGIDGNKNSKRTNSYHRLDIGFNGSFIWGSILVKPYLQILNVYNSPNEMLSNTDHFGFNLPERGSFIIPTLGLTVDF